METVAIVLVVVFEVWVIGAIVALIGWMHTFRLGGTHDRPISEGLIAAALWPKFAVEVFLGFLIEMSPLIERLLTRGWRRLT